MQIFNPKLYVVLNKKVKGAISFLGKQPKGEIKNGKEANSKQV